MAAKKNADGLAFLVDALRKDRNVSYADAQAAAKKKGLKVWPIMFGKAKHILGHVKSGAGKGAKRRAAKAAKAMSAGKRGPGRPRKIAATGVDGLDGIVAAVRNSRQELARYQSAIERIGSIIASIRA